jgi:hypothetical protein
VFPASATNEFPVSLAEQNTCVSPAQLVPRYTATTASAVEFSAIVKL